MAEGIDYGNLMHRAMRGLIQQVLQGVSEDGLIGDHHFFITFDTQHPKVKLAVWLTERYPTEMTVVIQHWFEDLDVTDEGFSITLNFGDNRETLYVPYDSIKTFVDPSVEFGLRFETQDEEDADVTPLPEPEAPQEEAEPVKQDTDADVVSLDSFRK